MTAGTLVPEALRLPAAPLLAAVDQAAHDRRTSVSDVLGKSGQKAYARARAVRKVTLAQVETVCDRLGCHPYELYGPAYQRLALTQRLRPPGAGGHRHRRASRGLHPAQLRPAHPARRAGRAGRRRRPVLCRLLRPRPLSRLGAHQHEHGRWPTAPRRAGWEVSVLRAPRWRRHRPLPGVRPRRHLRPPDLLRLCRLGRLGPTWSPALALDPGRGFGQGVLIA